MFLSVVILGGFTTETHAMASLHQDRHANISTTPGDVNSVVRGDLVIPGVCITAIRDTPPMPT